LPKNKRGKNENVVGATEIEDKPLTPVTIRQTTFEVVLDFSEIRLVEVQVPKPICSGVQKAGIRESFEPWV